MTAGLRVLVDGRRAPIPDCVHDLVDRRVVADAPSEVRPGHLQVGVEQHHARALGRLAPDRIERTPLPERTDVVEHTAGMKETPASESGIRIERGPEPVVGVQQELEGHAPVHETTGLIVLTGRNADDGDPGVTEPILALGQLGEQLEAGQSTVVAQDLYQHPSTGELGERS